MWGRSNPKTTGVPTWGVTPVQKPTNSVKEYDTRSAYFDWERESKDEPNVDILDIFMKIEKGNG